MDYYGLTENNHILMFTTPEIVWILYLVWYWFLNDRIATILLVVPVPFHGKICSFPDVDLVSAFPSPPQEFS